MEPLACWLATCSNRSLESDSSVLFGEGDGGWALLPLLRVFFFNHRALVTATESRIIVCMGNTESNYQYRNLYMYQRDDQSKRDECRCVTPASNLRRKGQTAAAE